MVANPDSLFPNHGNQAAAATSGKLLTVDHVNLEYRTRERIVRATHDVSFDVYGGDRFVLLGPSGCGKSTLLKAVAGFIQSTSGSISLDGRMVRGPGADRIVVFQEFDQLPPWKTVLQNVAFPLRVAKKLSRAQANERALHYLEKVGLASFANAYPHTLSGGMKQRVAIARALAMQPRVLLMDEPFAALDEITRFRLVDDLLRLRAVRRLGILFVTHSVYEAVSLADRIVVMSGAPGRVARVIDLDPTMPRGAAFRASPTFAETAATVSRALADAMAPAAPVDATAASG